MKGMLASLLILLGFSIGLLQSSRLRSRVRELEVFQSAVLSMKSIAAYSAADLPTVLALCRDNSFIAYISEKGNPVQEWIRAAKIYFTYAADCSLAEDFMSGYGNTDLSGLLAYISLYESRIASALSEARQNASGKCRLYTALGLFAGTAAALVLC